MPISHGYIFSSMNIISYYLVIIVYRVLDQARLRRRGAYRNSSKIQVFQQANLNLQGLGSSYKKRSKAYLQRPEECL